MRIAILFAGILAATPAAANCVLVTGPCYTDSRGNTYTTDRNLSGGYTTYRNGSTYSHTNQEPLSGNYRERFTSGGSNAYDRDPYRDSFRRPGESWKSYYDRQ